jgi:CO/xanthine dehydrogenase FAD-binding subunit
MIAACATLDGVAEIWGADGTVRRVPVASIPTGNGSTSLAQGDLVRAIDLPCAALTGRTALRKIALAERGRSGAVVTGRLDADGVTTVVVTAATLTPAVLRFASPPSLAEAADAARTPTDFYTDALGAADWRRHVAGVLAAEVVEELLS